MLPTKFQVNWLLGLGEEAGGHLGFMIGTILAIFDLQVTPNLSYQVSIQLAFRFKRRSEKWRPSWISDRHNFSYF